MCFHVGRTPALYPTMTATLAADDPLQPFYIRAHLVPILKDDKVSVCTPPCYRNTNSKMAWYSPCIGKFHFQPQNNYHNELHWLAKQQAHQHPYPTYYPLPPYTSTMQPPQEHLSTWRHYANMYHKIWRIWTYPSKQWRWRQCCQCKIPPIPPTAMPIYTPLIQGSIDHHLFPACNNDTAKLTPTTNTLTTTPLMQTAMMTLII